MVVTSLLWHGTGYGRERLQKKERQIYFLLLERTVKKVTKISVREATRSNVDKEIAEAAQINTFFPEGEQDVISIRNRLVDDGVIEGIGKPDKTGAYRRPRRVQFKTPEQRDLDERRQSMVGHLKQFC